MIKEDDEEGDEQSENVFGAALNDFKKQNWQENYHNQNNLNAKDSHNQPNLLHQAPQGSSIYEDQHLLHKFNYVSLLLDDYCDKNTSLNTKALASKYLKNQPVSAITTNSQPNQQLSGQNTYEASSHSELFNSCYIPGTSSTTSIMLDSGMKYDQLFQYYTENPSSTFTTIHNSNNQSVYRSSENSSIDSNHTQFDVYKHNMHNNKQHSISIVVRIFKVTSVILNLTNIIKILVSSRIIGLIVISRCHFLTRGLRVIHRRN